MDIYQKLKKVCKKNMKLLNTNVAHSVFVFCRLGDGAVVVVQRGRDLVGWSPWGRG